MAEGRGGKVNPWSKSPLVTLPSFYTANRKLNYYRKSLRNILWEALDLLSGSSLRRNPDQARIISVH